MDILILHASDGVPAETARAADRLRGLGVSVEDWGGASALDGRALADRLSSLTAPAGIVWAVGRQARELGALARAFCDWPVVVVASRKSVESLEDMSVRVLEAAGRAGLVGRWRTSLALAVTPTPDGKAEPQDTPIPQVKSQVVRAAPLDAQVDKSVPAGPVSPAGANRSSSAMSASYGRTIKLGRRDEAMADDYERRLQAREPVAGEAVVNRTVVKTGAVLQAALGEAGQVAQRSGARLVSSAHLLLAMLSTEGASAVQHIVGSTPDLEALESAVQASCQEASDREQPAVLDLGTELSAVLRQGRAESRARGSLVVMTSDVLRAMITVRCEARDLLRSVGTNIELLRELLDEEFVPDSESLPELVKSSEPVAEVGWPDKLAGLDPETRALLESGQADALRATLDVRDIVVPKRGGVVSAPAEVLPVVAKRPASGARRVLARADEPPFDLIEQAALELQRGNLVVFPSDGGLRLLASLDHEEASMRLLKLRRSSGAEGTEVLIHAVPMLRHLLPPDDESAPVYRLGEQLWPGLVALRIPMTRGHAAHELLSAQGESDGWHWGIRLPDHFALGGVLSMLDRPVVALAASARDWQFDALRENAASGVSLWVDEAEPAVSRPAVIETRVRPAALVSAGDAALDPARLRAALQG